MEKIEDFLKEPEELLKKEPFIRGGDYTSTRNDIIVAPDTKNRVQLPTQTGYEITQDKYMREFTPSLHDINFNASVPKFKVKLTDGGYLEDNFLVPSSAFQKNIHAKQCLHLTANPMEFSLLNTTSDEMSSLSKLFAKWKANASDNKDKATFLEFKQEWNYRNMDKIRNKAVSRQKSTGDCAILYSYDPTKKKLKSKVLSYKEGYVVIPNYDDFGDQIAVSLYYKVGNKEKIQTYDDKYVYKFEKNNVESGDSEFVQKGTPTTHGFSRCPLLYKRGYVAWEFAQSAIDMYEVIKAIHAVTMKRHGWSWLWIKGTLENNSVTNTEGGTVIMNDKNVDGKSNGDMKAIEFPEAKGISEMLKDLKRDIMYYSSTTFILPDDISLGSDVSGIAVMLTMNGDYSLALQTANDWADFADNMAYLFAEGLGLEQGDISKFTKLKIKASFKVWMPQSEYQYNSMMVQLAAAKLTSKRTAIEKISVSAPDEMERLYEEAAIDSENELANTDNNTNQSGF